MSPPRTHDASRLSFSLQLLITTAATAVTVYGVIWADRLQNSERAMKIESDIRNINTLLMNAKDLREKDQQILDLRFENLASKSAADVLRGELMRVMGQKITAK